MKLLIILSLSAAAVAQVNSSSGALTGVIGPVPAGIVSNGAFPVTGIGAGMSGGVITGAPYSAEQITERVQTLADGTHISQPPQTVKFYRDSQGRTRTERIFPVLPGTSAAVEAPSLIEISDPVIGERYTLEPRSRTAHKTSFRALPPPPPPPPGSATMSANRAIRVLPAIVPPPVPAAQNQPERPQISRESLGSQNIEGVLAEGSRTTVVYPVGALGNDRPITTVSETWTSSELKTVVLSKNSDPRNGDSTTRLTNISRAEPDPSMFQVPSGYEVIDPRTAAAPKQ
jgi:hypothetical protein